MAKTIHFEPADLYPKQRAAIYDGARISCIESSTKAGKAQPLDAIVYTPFGPVKMGDVSVGDEICTPDGAASRVKGIYPQGEQDIYQITLSDGTAAESTLDHLWRVSGQTGKPETVPLSEIITYPDERLRRTWISVSQPVRFRERELPIPPYSLGAILGDGCTHGEQSVMLSSNDSQIRDEMLAELPRYQFNYSAGYDYRLALREPYQWVPEGERLIPSLKKLGLWDTGSHQRFIPSLYRYNSVANRWGIVRGLMDTDGSVDRNGQPILEVTSERLANDFAEVVRSLGGIVRIGTKQGSYRNADGLRINCRTVYRCRVTHHDARMFFTLQRKLDRCLVKKKPMKRTLRSIVLVRRAEAQCIELEDRSGLYLTDNVTVTHNTSGCLAWFIENGLKAKHGTNGWWVAPVYSQTEIAFRRCWAMLAPIKTMCKRNQSTFLITLPNGVRLMFKSGDRPDDLYGEDVYFCVMDEASRMREESWHAVRSTLTFTKGPVRIIGNVRGRKNWFYRLSRLAESGVEDMSFHRITAWDAVQAGVLDKKEIESAKRDFSRLGQEEVFRQLYLAEALDDSSNPFGIKAIEACFTLKKYSKEYPVAAGVDLAGRGAVNLVSSGDAQSRDYTAICMFDRNGDCTYLERFRKPHAETQREVVRRVGRVQVLIDSTGSGDSMVEELQRRGDMRVLGYTFTPRSRQDLLEGLALAIQEERVHFPDVKMGDGKGSLRDELESFEFEYTPRGVSYRAPEGVHDDLVMAVALAVKRMPWKLKVSTRPVGIPQLQGSKWTSEATGDDDAWRKYQASLKPTLGKEQQADPLPESIPVPIIASGNGKSRWSQAG